jgi:putative transposase
MSGTCHSILLHIVFSTKNRTPWITPDLRERLSPFIGGILRAEKGALYEIGGVADHVHLYVRWRPNSLVSDLLREIKSGSSLWIHQDSPGLVRSRGKRVTRWSR